MSSSEDGGRAKRKAKAASLVPSQNRLPISNERKNIIATVQKARALVIVGETGSGKLEKDTPLLKKKANENRQPNCLKSCLNVDSQRKE
ncbi:hypothetical protein HDU77_011058 [Chytriomyces hyalinus]|nr:hypothetical protein HDU77_011058 [Chytriomyces hyalinus]